MTLRQIRRALRRHGFDTERAPGGYVLVSTHDGMPVDGSHYSLADLEQFVRQLGRR